MRRLLLALGFVLGGAGLVLASRPDPARQAAAVPPPATAGDAIHRAYLAAYSLDYAEAEAMARRATALGPNESRTHRALASVLWLDILFRRGACTVDLFIGGMAKALRATPGPAAELEAEFKQELGQSIALAEAQAKLHPGDIEARHDVGAAYAIQASYTASVEGSLIAAFRSARRAYDAHEQVLTQAPDRADANFAVGIYRYVVSTLSMPSRFVAYLAGFGGGKERGIMQLESTTKDPEVHVDAKAALLLIYTREGRHLDALRIARELEAEFPRNRLFVFEHGAAAIRAGRAEDAEATLSRGIAGLAADNRPKFPGEPALWLYKRGMARVSLNHLADAQHDLDAALASDPAGWVGGRVRVELGKIADLTGRRKDALASYQQARTMCERYIDAACARAASEYMKRPFIH
jgi:tetratricopeptide (TPR) repeat protein